ncbi:hypothetical protein DVT68_11070 [Dyella solisilvae]|uniref:Peptidase A2 domain-containing protein n=2 Tax=Dyella solisilvae TaxID=1920168 RepID=A0A370K9D6_9GAMM|nr:hypothetical protein DVT68_11070 [Dyella solisilvae]
MRLFCLIGSFLLANQVWADDCQLSKIGKMRVDMMGLRPTTLVRVNGTNTRFILDTGAFYNFMSSANAASMGLDPFPAPKGFKMSGVGGDVNVKQAFVNRFAIPGMPIKNVIFLVGGSDAGNALIGANLLEQADLELDLAHGSVTMFEPIQCDNTPLAYWAKEYSVVDILPSRKNSFDRRTFLIVQINGTRLRALLDSGAPVSVMARFAAERAKVNVITPGSKAVVGTGVGANSVKEWTVNVDAFSIGAETINNTQMQVIDGSIANGVDVLLGADFLLSHHVYIANRQKKVYFTYNGGRVFANATAASNSDTPDGVAADNNDKPKNAGDYYLAGQAHLARGDIVAAIDDLDDAIRLSPHQSSFFVARARAHVADKHPNAALDDLDIALSLDPKNGDALLTRAELRLSSNDRAGAASDVVALSNMLPSGSMQAQAVADLDIKLGQPMAALPLLDGWIVMHENDAMLGHVLSERCMALGLSNQMLNDALRDCNDAIRRDGKKPDYLESLGLVEWRLGHYSESIKAYKQAVDQAPDSAWSRYGLGLAEISYGRQDSGVADLNAARALDPQIDERAAKYGMSAAR